jgi:hypothetical protein
MARLKDAAAQEWMKAERLVRKHGLPLPARRRDEIIKALEAEIARPDRAGHALLRALCALLWSAQSPKDAPLIARAKFLNFDAGAMVDAEFILCGGRDAVLAALHADGAGSAVQAVEALPLTYAFDDKLAAEQAFYGIETLPDEG